MTGDIHPYEWVIDTFGSFWAPLVQMLIGWGIIAYAILNIFVCTKIPLRKMKRAFKKERWGGRFIYILLFAPSYALKFTANVLVYGLSILEEKN